MCCYTGQCDASEQYVRQLKDLLVHSTPKKGGVAAFISEPIQVEHHCIHVHIHLYIRISVGGESSPVECVCTVHVNER